jgi:RNA polymerase sigma factor (sigma-70 family)
VTAAARAFSPARAPRHAEETPAPDAAIVAPMRTRAGAAFETVAELPDAALLALYAEGDQAAARTLTARHAPRVFALARRMLADAPEAEDVTQETMLRLWKIAPDWQADRAAVSTWLYRVASNLCIDRLRRRRELASDAAPDLPDDSPGPERRLQQRDQAAALEAALAALPDRQRLAIVLRHLEERPNPEIAAILDSSVEAVESLLARARRDLARRLAPRKAELGFTDG